MYVPLLPSHFYVGQKFVGVDLILSYSIVLVCTVDEYRIRNMNFRERRSHIADMVSWTIIPL
jgi:hypothetical protein